MSITTMLALVNTLIIILLILFKRDLDYQNKTMGMILSRIIQNRKDMEAKIAELGKAKRQEKTS